MTPKRHISRLICYRVLPHCACRGLWGFSPSMAKQMARAHETALWPLGDWRIQLVTGACLVRVGTGFSHVALRQAAVSWNKRTA
jgi:hypothetical protein